MTRLAVIGGGITGLLASHKLQQHGHRVTVFEASDTPGGKIRGSEIAGMAVADGPDAFLPRDEVPLELLREFGLEETASPAVFGAYIWHGGRLRRLPAGSPYGIPCHPSEAWRAGLLSGPGAARAGLENLNRSVLSGPDVSVGAFIRARFGDEVLTNLVDPLLAGIRGGVADEMSLSAGAKEIDVIARNNRSVLRTLRQREPEAPRFIKPAGGIVAIIDALAARMEDLRTSMPIQRLAIDGSTTNLSTSSGSEAFDGVVLACPTFAAAELLRDLDPHLARDLDSIRYASLAVITLVYPPGSFQVPQGGSGFLVPTASGLTISACTWYSTKWPDVTSDGRQVVRCVIGRAGEDPSLEGDDEVLLSLVQRDLAVTMGLETPSVAHRVTRWERSIPQYRVGHVDLVASIEERLAARGPIVVAGAGYRGSGIPDCIAQATAAARTLAGLVPVGRG